MTGKIWRRVFDANVAATKSPAKDRSNKHIARNLANKTSMIDARAFANVDRLYFFPLSSVFGKLHTCHTCETSNPAAQSWPTRKRFRPLSCLHIDVHVHVFVRVCGSFQYHLRHDMLSCVWEKGTHAISAYAYTSKNTHSLREYVLCKWWSKILLCYFTIVSGFWPLQNFYLSHTIHVYCNMHSGCARTHIVRLNDIN